MRAVKTHRFNGVRYYIGVDEPADEMFGKTMSIPDDLIVPYFELVADVTLTRFNEIKQALSNSTTNPRDIKLELAETIVRVAGSGRWEFAPFTPERKAQEPGDFYSDISKIRRVVGWEPKTSLEEGLRRTIEYYRRYKDKYW